MNATRGTQTCNVRMGLKSWDHRYRSIDAQKKTVDLFQFLNLRYLLESRSYIKKKRVAHQIWSKENYDFIK